MTVRFDDALPNLIRAARSAGVDLASDDVAVVRDAAGRLGIGFRTKPPLATFHVHLRDTLGPYALSPSPVLSSLLFDALIEAGPTTVSILVADGDYQHVNFLDRRVVGADWLEDFVPPASGPPRMVFGSLKGGVGRSTALAVLAADLAAHGKRVLCIDLDLEAPGIGSMLLREAPEDDRRPKFGAIDYLVENGLGGVLDDELYDHIGLSHFGGGAIDVLPAVGRVTDANPTNMIGKLSRALTEEVTGSSRKSVSTKIRDMVDRFASRAEYDAILIDSRAGLAETTASTWLGVGAHNLLLFGVNQPQTFHGYRYLLGHMLQMAPPPDSPDRDDWRSRIGFVQGKAPFSPDEREQFRENIHDLCAEMLYDQDPGFAAEPVFNFSFDMTGPNVPHDVGIVEHHPLYDAFNPMANPLVLERDGYIGPFSCFLAKAWARMGLERLP